MIKIIHIKEIHCIYDRYTLFLEEKNKKQWRRKKDQYSYRDDNEDREMEIKVNFPDNQQCKSKSRAILNEGTEDELIITGFRFNLYKSMLMGLLFIFTAGLLWLFLYWMPKIRLRFTHDIVDLELADTVLIEVRMSDQVNKMFHDKLNNLFLYT